MKKYPVGGIAIGLLQLIDACILYLNHGIVSNLTLTLSFVELLWAFVSLIVIIRVKARATRILASVFFAYSVSGFLFGIFFMDPTAPIMVPIWYAIFGGLFGLIYAASSFYVAKQP